jgi:hypothetical protein
MIKCVRGVISPRCAALAPEHVDKVFAELARILAHFKFTPISDVADKGDFMDVTALP